MTGTRGRRYWLVACLAAGAVGPLVSYVSFGMYSWAASNGATGVVDVLMDIGSVLWPFQMFGVLEYKYGSAISGTMLISSNMALFLALGLALATRRTFHLTLVCSSIAAYLSLCALWASGFNLSFVSWVSLFVSVVFFGGWIYLGRRLNRL